MNPAHQYLHKPVQPTGEGLALTHGAGGDCHSALIVAIAEAFAEAGITVLRFDMAYRRARSSGPPSPSSSSKDRQSIAAALDELRGQVSGPLFLAGQSYGGRQASMLASENPATADALALFSYPLHPPGKPEQMRTAHFPALHIPAIFIHGVRDPFAASGELETALKLIPAQTALHEVPKAGHELLKGRFPLAPVIAALRGFKR